MSQNIIELREKRNKLMVDAQQLVLDKDFTAEKRAKADAMLADSDVISADIARIERLAAFDAEQRNSNRPARNQPEVGNVDAEKRAFRDYIVHGKQTEQRDLGVGPVAGSISGGSQLVAPSFSPILTSAQLSYGGVLNFVSHEPTDTGASRTIPLNNDTANGLLTWPEDTAASSADPSLSFVTSNTQQYNTGAIYVTLEMLQDSNFDIDSFVKDIFGQRLFRGLAKNISQGSGSFASYFSAGVSGATSAAGLSVSYIDLLNLQNAVDDSYQTNAIWTMNQQTRGALLSVLDSSGRPLFSPALTAPGGASSLGTLLGKPVVLDPYAPNIALSSKSIAYGDFKAGFAYRNVGQFSIMRDPYTFMVSKGAVAFIGYGRGGSYSKNAGTNPIKYLTQKSS